MIILLNTYKNEAPYIERINFFDDILNQYRLVKKTSRYDLYLLIE